METNKIHNKNVYMKADVSTLLEREKQQKYYSLIIFICI